MEMQSFPTKRLMSAFANQMFPDKLEDYTRVCRLLEYSNEFPPIWGYESEITKDMIGQEFLHGNEELDNFRTVQREHVGLTVWFVTDGHHRAMSFLNAGLDFIDVIPDRACLTTEDELKEWDEKFVEPISEYE